MDVSRQHRPPSEQLADLHVYSIPTELWRQNLHSAVNGVINDSVSVGFLRVNPQARIQDLREELVSQLGAENLPKDYVFLRSVGRCLTQVRGKQEAQLRIKYFLPPITFSPEIYILESGNFMGTPTSLQSVESLRSDGQGNRSQAEPNHRPDVSMSRLSQQPLTSQPDHPDQYDYVQQPGQYAASQPNIRSPPQHLQDRQMPYRQPPHGYTGNPTHPDFSGHHGRVPYATGPDVRPTYTTGSDPSFDQRRSPPAGDHRSFSYNGYPSENPGQTHYSPPHIQPSSPSYSPQHRTTHNATAQPNGSILKRVVGREDAYDPDASIEEEDGYHSPSGRASKRSTGHRRGDRSNDVTETHEQLKDSVDLSSSFETAAEEGGQTSRSRGGDRTAPGDKTEGSRCRTRTLTKENFGLGDGHVEDVSDSTDTEQKERSGSPQTLRLSEQKIQEDMNEQKSQLTDELARVRQERFESEKTRGDLLKKAKITQTKTENKRNQAKEVWKKRYFEQKKQTAPLEEEISKLQNDLETTHKKVMGHLESGQRSGVGGASGGAGSKKNSMYRVQSERLHHEITEMQRKVESSKIKLTAEMRLRNQAETELRAMKVEVSQRKNNINLSRQQQVSTFRAQPPVHAGGKQRV